MDSHRVHDGQTAAATSDESRKPVFRMLGSVGSYIFGTVQAEPGGHLNEIIHRCMTKALVAPGDCTLPSARWALSRRGTLSVFSDRLVCGDWSIPYDTIEEAVLHSGA